MHQLVTTIDPDIPQAQLPGIIYEPLHQEPMGTQQIFQTTGLPDIQVLIGLDGVSDFLNIFCRGQHPLSIHNCGHLPGGQRIMFNG